MFISEGIVGNVFWKLEAIVVLLKDEKEYLFTDFPIGATIQDGGKRKRSVNGHMTSSSSNKIKSKIIKNK